MSTHHALRPVRVALAAALLAGLAAAGGAQTIRGTLTGNVTDSSGGVVPGATVTATNPATGIAESVVTNQQGGYTLPLLPPGMYRVTVELPGCQSYWRGGERVEIALSSRTDG